MEKISYSFSMNNLQSGDSIRQAMKRYVGALFYEEPLTLGNGQQSFFWGVRPTPNHPIVLVVVNSSHEPLNEGGKYMHLIIETMCPIGGKGSEYTKYLKENVKAIMLSCMELSNDLFSGLSGSS